MTTPPTIIISEPDPMISGALRVEFSRWDFAVLLAPNSTDAEIYSSHTVASLIVLDVSKAPLKAFEACARIRRSIGYAYRPIILTGNEVSARTEAAAAKAGATALLPKPYSVTDLFDTITPHLSEDDPLLLASGKRSGMAAKMGQEWKFGGPLEWRTGGNTALARNNMLLPIVRGAGKKIPLYRIS